MIEFIIPTYNRPNQLLTVIGSILSQTNSNWKIHVVADAIYPGYENVKDFFYQMKILNFQNYLDHIMIGATLQEFMV